MCYIILIMPLLERTYYGLTLVPYVTHLVDDFDQYLNWLLARGAAHHFG